MPEGPLLDLRHLQMIRAIAAHGRVTDAAEALGVTPSALSHRIREAERRLGVVLFVRMHKRLRMTPAAEYLAETATRILTDLDRVEQDVRRMDRGVDHVVRIAVEAYSSYHWLPEFTETLRRAAPGIDLQIMAGMGRDALHALGNRDADLIIVSGEATPQSTRGFPLFDDELVFIMPPGHRLADKDVIEGADIAGEAFITFARTPEPDREFARLFRPSDSYPRWTATVELPEAIVELVAAGQGTSVLAGWAVRPAIEAGRILGARVGAEGIAVRWQALIRASDVDPGPIRTVAETLSAWAQARGGFG